MNEIEERIKNKLLLTDEEIAIFIEYIINQVRTIVNDESMTNKCDLVQGLIGRYLDSLGVSYNACSTQGCIMPDLIGHSFIVINLQDKYYLIDPSFIQFKINDHEYKNVYIKNSRCLTVSPYHTGININKDIINKLIEDGYLPLTEEVAYTYGNAFFQTLTGVSEDHEFNNIPGDIYIKAFLKGNDKLRKYDEYEEIPTNEIKNNRSL